MRGHMDKDIDRFERIEQLIAADLGKFTPGL